MPSKAFGNVPRCNGNALRKGQPKGKGEPMPYDNASANKSNRSGAGREFHANGEASDLKGAGKGGIPSSKGQCKAEGGGARKLHGQGNVNGLKGTGKGGTSSSKGMGKAKGKGARELRSDGKVSDLLSSKGKGKATQNDDMDAAITVQVAAGSSAAGKRLGRNGPRNVSCPTGGVAAGSEKRKRRKRRPNKSNSEVCAVCQECLLGPCDRLDCMHAFHMACASQCVAHIRRAGCPICRAPAPVWLSGVAAHNSVDVTALTSVMAEYEAANQDVSWDFQGDTTDSDSQGDAPYFSNINDSWDPPARFSHSSISDSDDYDDCRLGEIDQLREEFPDLDSDALEDLYEDRMQDFDESGSYYSHGS